MMKLTILSVLVFAVGLGAHQIYAAEDEAEAKEAAEEDAARKKRENELDRPIFQYIIGILELKSKEQRGDGKGVIGTLKATNKEYTIKISAPELMDQFEKFDGKRARLIGNPQNKGKYFVASGASVPPPTATEK